MRDRSVLIVLTLALGLIFLCPSQFAAQTAVKEKPKLKDFGESLKRLKWDARRNVTVANAKTDAGDEDVVRVDTSLVVSDLLVLDAKRKPIEDLTAADFTVSEDGIRQEVRVFSPGDSLNLARSIVLIIDYSRSQYPYLETSIDAAKTLIDNLSPQDQMAIVTDDVELLADFTSDKTLLKSKLDLLLRRTKTYPGALTEIFGRRQPRFGRSAQYSALMATLNEAFDEDLRPIIIFQTDGDEVFNLRNPIVIPSIPPGLVGDLLEQEQKLVQQRRQEVAEQRVEFSLEDVYLAAEKSRATIYTVIPGLRFVGLRPEELVERARLDHEKMSLAWASTLSGQFKGRAKQRMRERLEKTPPEAWAYRANEILRVQAALDRLAQLSGGSTDYLEDPSQAQQIYARILAEIKRRYLIGYYPSNRAHDGKRRKIQIEVHNHPEYQIISRKFYFAPGPQE